MTTDLTTKETAKEKDQPRELRESRERQISPSPSASSLADLERIERSLLGRSSSALGGSPSTLSTSQSPLRDSGWMKNLPALSGTQLPNLSPKKASSSSSISRQSAETVSVTASTSTIPPKQQFTAVTQAEGGSIPPSVPQESEQQAPISESQAHSGGRESRRGPLRIEVTIENLARDGNTPPPPSKIAKGINKLMALSEQKKFWLSITLTLGFAYGNFLPVLMLGAINLMPAVMAVSLYVCLWTAQGLRESYKQNCARKVEKTNASTTQPLSKELAEAFTLGQQSAESYAAQLHACVSPRLWFYPSYQRAYYAGQMQAENEQAPFNKMKNSKIK